MPTGSLCTSRGLTQASCLGFDPVAHTGLLEFGSSSPGTASESITRLPSGPWASRYHCVINLTAVLAGQFTPPEPWSHI